jgi:hypothetical protein
MKSPADALPPEIARQIDPDWRKNEAAYWAGRPGRWASSFGHNSIAPPACFPLG